MRLNRPLGEGTRRQLIRETVTCAQAYVSSKHVSSKHFEEANSRFHKCCKLVKDTTVDLELFCLVAFVVEGNACVLLRRNSSFAVLSLPYFFTY